MPKCHARQVGSILKSVHYTEAGSLLDISIITEIHRREKAVFTSLPDLA